MPTETNSDRSQIVSLAREDSELETEYRHKFLAILKSKYWYFFERGMCGTNSITVLVESVDRAIDHETNPM
jgi:hypothetical protein